MDEENLIKVLLVEPFDKPKMITIENNYQAISEIICGDADEYMPFEDDVALLVTLTVKDFLFLQVT